MKLKFNKFTMGLMAFAIAVSGLAAAPARANDTQDVLKALGGVLAVIAIGKAIDHELDKKKDKDKKKNKKKQAEQAQKAEAQRAREIARAEAKREADRRKEAETRWAAWERDREEREAERRRIEEQRRYEWMNRDVARQKPQTTGYDLPRDCVVQARDSEFRRQTVAIETCLQREAGNRDLTVPKACRTNANTRYGEFKAYDMTCLSSFGYRAASR